MATVFGDQQERARLFAMMEWVTPDVMAAGLASDDPASAKRHWDAMESFFGAHLT